MSLTIILWLALAALAIAIGWARTRTILWDLITLAGGIAAIPVNLAIGIASRLRIFIGVTIVLCTLLILVGLAWEVRVLVAIGSMIWLVFLVFWSWYARALAWYITGVLGIGGQILGTVQTILGALVSLLGIPTTAPTVQIVSPPPSPAPATPAGHGGHGSSGGSTTPVTTITTAPTPAQISFAEQVRTALQWRIACLIGGSAFIGLCLTVAPYWETLGHLTVISVLGMVTMLIPGRGFLWGLGRLIAILALLTYGSYATSDIAINRSDQILAWFSKTKTGKTLVSWMKARQAKVRATIKRDNYRDNLDEHSRYAEVLTKVQLTDRGGSYLSPTIEVNEGDYVEYVDPDWDDLDKYPDLVQVRRSDEFGLILPNSPSGWIPRANVDGRSVQEYQNFKSERAKAAQMRTISTSPPVSVLKKVRGITVPAGETKAVPIPLEEQDNVLVFSQPDYPRGSISVTVDENTTNLYTYKYPFVAGPNSVLQVHNRMEKREANLLVYNFGQTQIPEDLKNRVVRMVTVVVSNPGAREVIVNCVEPFGNNEFPCERLPAEDQVWDIFFPSDYSLVFTGVDGRELTRVPRPLTNGMRIKIP